MSSGSDPRPRWSLLRILVVAFAVCFANAALWSLITPLGASPDEPAHIVKAGGVVRGQWFGEDVDGTQTRQFTVPSGLSAVKYLAVCNMARPEAPAGCAAIDERRADTLVQERSTAGLYNPSYYLLVGWPSLLDGGVAGMTAMRLVSAALVALFAALAIGMLALLPRSRIPVAAAVIAFTPMVWFLGGSVNPNALEATATAAFFAALVVMLRVRPRGRLATLAITTLVVSGVLVTQVRTLGFVWLGVAVLVAVVLHGGLRSAARIIRGPLLGAAVAVAIAAAVAIAIALSTGTLGQNGVYGGAGTPYWEGLRIMLDRTFDYLRGAIGLFGWGDAPAPEFTYAVYLAAGIGLIAAVLVLRPRSRAAAGLLTALGAFALLPPLIQAASVETSGYIWQGRYSLALFAVLILTAAIAAGRLEPEPAVERRLARALIAAGALAGASAAITALRRQAVGYATDTIALWGETPWMPLGILTRAWVALILLVALGTGWGLIALAERGARRPRPLAAPGDG